MSSGFRQATYAIVAGIAVIALVYLLGLQFRLHKAFYLLAPGTMLGMWLHWNPHGFLLLGSVLLNICFYAGIVWLALRLSIRPKNPAAR